MENPETSADLLNQLQKIGITVAVDDFGTGYSSLSYLKLLPINTIKIDRAFIQDIPENRDSIAITEAILSMSTQPRT